jgi:hypothetical protein
MNAAARFVIRPDGTLILGIKTSLPSALRPGYVYEVVDVDGDLVIFERGPSCIGEKAMEFVEGPDGNPVPDPSRPPQLLSWWHDANTLIEDCGKWLVSTAREWAEAVRTGQT